MKKQKAKKKHSLLIILTLASFILLCLTGFLFYLSYRIIELFPVRIEMSDPKIVPLLNAAESFDRVKYGFSPLPEKADVRLESRPMRQEYDAMLHISSKTSRTIAFRKTDKGYRWIGEQETFRGPNRYKTIDGTFYEEITLTFHIEKFSGFPTNRLKVSYFGEDPRLANLRKLTIKDVQPILREWGY